MSAGVGFAAGGVEIVGATSGCIAGLGWAAARVVINSQLTQRTENLASPNSEARIAIFAL